MIKNWNDTTRELIKYCLLYYDDYKYVLPDATEASVLNIIIQCFYKSLQDELSLSAIYKIHNDLIDYIADGCTLNKAIKLYAKKNLTNNCDCNNRDN